MILDRSVWRVACGPAAARRRRVQLSNGPAATVRVHVVELGNASQWAWVRGSGLLAAAAYAVAASGGCCGLMSMISKWQRDGATTARAVALRPSCPFRPPPPPPSRAQ
jgi:hypothetical protein